MLSSRYCNCLFCSFARHTWLPNLHNVPASLQLLPGQVHSYGQCAHNRDESQEPGHQHGNLRVRKNVRACCACCNAHHLQACVAASLKSCLLATAWRLVVLCR